MKNSSLIIIAIAILNSCSSVNNSTVVKKQITNNSIVSLNSDKKLYSKIYQNIAKKNLDGADDAYIKLKTNYENSQYLNSAADTLAVVHMQNSEYILANFYLQEALQANSSDEFAKFMLVKNQFLSANNNSRDLNYMNRALKALQIDNSLVYGDYAILANSMLIRVKLDMAWKNIQIGNLYKRLNKENAVKIYKQKVEQLGININEIDKK